MKNTDLVGTATDKSKMTRRTFQGAWHGKLIPNVGLEQQPMAVPLSQQERLPNRRRRGTNGTVDQETGNWSQFVDPVAKSTLTLSAISNFQRDKNFASVASSHPLRCVVSHKATATSVTCVSQWIQAEQVSLPKDPDLFLINFNFADQSVLFI